MRTFDRIFAAVIVVILLVFAGSNLCIACTDRKADGQYRVEAKRLAEDIAAGESVDLTRYPSIIGVEKLEEGNTKAFFEGGNENYLIKEIDGAYYRFDYRTEAAAGRHRLAFIVNTVTAVLAAAVLLLLFFIKRYVILPFEKLSELPYELAKGNLTLPIKENKNRFFGRFLWGMDLLRENLELRKKEELALQKEKKTLMLSLSHDIKTPLQAIKLYAKALSKDSSRDQEKVCDIAEKIDEKADEIGSYVRQITEANKENFLNLTVRNEEFYMSAAIREIEIYYEDKLELLKTEYKVGAYEDCILKGDLERVTEILQNIMENAIKYGDGRWIHILFSDEEDCRLITVKNSGCTLPENELPHIFDSFWRGSNIKNQSGSGLGLYICRQLLKQMDGEIFAGMEHDRMCVTVLLRKA
ncbi:MAG: HAMP domain-containing histidine kinase [Lachnospiraceae bacterium]|nr:HAMP domain-containing histidine kinase [Lachnospiraceae bacterium]MBD5538149.1 HAMP domain-containing histidine kinase [Lachnospiraceae bacterium]